MTGASEPTTQPGLHGNLAISRKIHKQLVNKKNRWKPSELELAVLKLHFQKNKYPVKEDKEDIIKSLEQNFQTKIDINQLSRWFQHEREKFQRQINKRSKNTYVKFQKEDLDFLQDRFQENNYPKIEDMKMMAQRLEVSLSKIENWYKHNRRSLAKRGHFQLKTKKYFKRDELSYLMEMFELHPRPNKDQILEMAEKLDCNETQIKNWYSNKRKKLKSLAKKKGFSYGEELLHKTDYPSFPKSTGMIDLDFNGFNNNFGMNSELPNIPNNLLPTTTTPQLPSFIPNGTLPTFHPAPIMLNGFPNSTIPLLIIPTTMNTSSSMIVNASIINNNIGGVGGGSSMFGNFQEMQPELKLSKSSSDPIKKIKTQSPPLLNTFNYPNPLTNNAFVPISAFTSQPIPAEQHQQQQPSGNSWLSNNQPNPNLLGGGVGIGIGVQGQPQNMQNMQNQQQNNVYNPSQISTKDNLPVFHQPNIISPLPLNQMASLPILSPINPIYPGNNGQPDNGNGGGQARVQYISSVYPPPGTSNNTFLNPYANIYQQNTQNLMMGGGHPSNQFNHLNQMNMNNQVPNNIIIQPSGEFEKRDININQTNFDGLKTCN